MFKLKENISIEVAGRKIIGQLIGIDSYELESFDDRRCKWPSYTLVSDRKGAFSRYWFVCWEGKEWILWTKAKSRRIPRAAKILFDKSGIAAIRFKGNAGPSTPVAALIQYKTGKDRYYCTERFAGSTVMLFDGQKIPKPKLVK